MNTSKIKEEETKHKGLGIVRIGYKKSKICIVLDKSKTFHDYYNVFVDNNYYCIHGKNIKFL